MLLLATISHPFTPRTHLSHFVQAGMREVHLRDVEALCSFSSECHTAATQLPHFST